MPRAPICHLALVFALAPLAAGAEPMTRITDRPTFLATIEGRTLTSMAVRLSVTADGLIAGSAFGTDVSGTWVWQDGYFCRTLYTATKDFPLNCQQVESNGNTIRFTADKGKGEAANLKIR